MKKGLTIKPNTTLENKTGAWRTHRPITALEKCIGCSLCAKLCPEGCIEMISINNKQKPRTDYDYCKGCGLCAKECPVKVIAMKEDY